MRQQWSACELDEYWTLLPGDLAHLVDLPDAGKLGFAAQLAFWRQNGRFPNEEADFAPAVVGRLAAQIGVGADALANYDWAGRTVRRHRRAILDHLAVAAFDETVETRFRRWLSDDLLPRELASAALEEEIGGWMRANGSSGLAHTGSIASCIRPKPSATMQHCSGWPTASTPPPADGSMPC
jgi:hypothetical protein